MNLSQISTIFAMLPGIIGIIQQVEHAIPGKGNGQKKLDLVLNTVNAAAGSIPAVATAIQGHDLNGTVTAVTAAAVNGLNAAGVFQK